MKYHISESVKKPAYLQLYEQLRADIVSGLYKFGTKLPSKRLLADDSGVSVITVEHAYSILCDEGYVESRQRSGYFVIYRKGDFLEISEQEKNSVLHVSDLSDTVKPPKEPLFDTERNFTHLDFPFSVLSKTMRKVLLDYGDKILVKSPNMGCVGLRTAISSYLARNIGITASPEQIVIGSGAEYLYSLIVQLLDDRKCFALETPSYEKIHKVYEANGIKCDLLSLGAHGIKTSELSRTNATVLHVTPFNSYPSNITASASKRSEYLHWAKERGGFIVEDNYDSELTISSKHEDTIFSLTENDDVIYLNTFSKTLAPSMRIGYMVLPEKLLPVFTEKLSFYSCTVPVFEQYVIAELLTNGDFERHVNRVRRARKKTFT